MTQKQYSDEEIEKLREWGEKELARMKKRPRNVLDINATLPGRLIIGKYWVWLAIVIYLFFWLIPWEWLYGAPNYRQFVELMAHLYPNIDRIAETRDKFPEYSMALVAFCGAFWPFNVLFYLYCGFVHSKHIDVSKVTNLSLKWKLQIGGTGGALLILSLVVIPIFDGIGRQSRWMPLPDIEERYLLILLGFWWMLAISVFWLTAFFSALRLGARHR